MDETRRGVDYWPQLIWQWFSSGSIADVIVEKQRINQLAQRDKQHGWRITHASVAMRSPDEETDAKICLQVFNGIERASCLILYSAKDRDGDTPLHSVVKTGDLKRLNILLDHLPLKVLKSTLQMTNKLGQTPLKVAFDQQEGEMLKRLLEYYIKNGLCSNLTGIGKNRQASTSLLHCAMDKGTDCSQFLEMCFKCGEPGLLVYDKKGRTPWYYLMNHKDPKILESVLCTLKKHNIDVNKLITDKHSGSGMLHLAYRKQRQECIKLLEDAGADPGKKDAGGVRADKRDHWIEGSQEGCEEQAAHEQQHIPPVPAESGVQSDESQQQMSSDVEAVEEEMSLNVLDPKHQLVCASSYSPQPDHEVPPHDSSGAHAHGTDCDEELPPSILPFTAQSQAGDDVSQPPVSSSAEPSSEIAPPSVPPPSLYRLLSFLLLVSSIPRSLHHTLHQLQHHLLYHPLYVVSPLSIPLHHVPPSATLLPPSAVAPSVSPSLYHILYDLLYYLLYQPLYVAPSVPPPPVPPSPSLSVPLPPPSAPPPVQSAVPPPPVPSPPIQPSAPPPAPPPTPPPAPPPIQPSAPPHPINE